MSSEENEVAKRARAARERTGHWPSTHGEALCAEVERLHEESVQWEKTSLCAILKQRDDLRRLLRIAVDEFETTEGRIISNSNHWTMQAREFLK